MKTFDFNSLLRKNIRETKPYSSARDEYKGNEGIFLDANENPIGSADGGKYNRYPDPLQWDLKEKIALIKRVNKENIFLGNGSDEAIDLLYRAICEPGKDNVITMPPTYGMYEVSAQINDIRLIEVPLDENFQIRTEAVLKAVNANTKMIFVCSPNNPTGNLLDKKAIETLLENFNGLVVIDEAYIDFAPTGSFVPRLSEYPNLLVMQTFSKAWGMAGLRLGSAYASEEIIAVLNRIKPPYNINQLTQEIAYKNLSNLLKKEEMVAEILFQRDQMVKALQKLEVITKIYPSDANFILVKTKNATGMYNFLVSKKIITRNRTKVLLCEGCVRITIGTGEENKALLEALKEYKDA